MTSHSFNLFNTIYVLLFEVDKSVRDILGRNPMKKLLFFTAIILLPVGLLGQYSGNLTGNTTWGPGEITVIGNIDAGGYVLTIAPGTTVKIYDNVRIFIPGPSRIIADGDETNKIIFEAYSNTWNHIELNSSSGNLFDHCIFRDGSDLTNWPWKGGAVYINLSSAIITNCTFTNNRAEMGGAITIYQSDVQLTDCEFYNNTATRGGAIHIQEDESDLTPNITVMIDRCKVYQNFADQTGGIHIANNSTAVIQNSLIFNNTSNVNGGIATNNFPASTLGLVTLFNCVVANNTPHDISFRGSARTTAQNCIFWGSEQSVFFLQDEPQSSNMTNCAVQGAWKNSEINIASTFTNSFKLNSLNSALDGPNFINPLTDYSILSVSPCKDHGITAGAPTTDYLRNTRVEPYDIGAYEVQRQLVSWTGEENSDWMDVDNWSSGAIPGSGDDVRITNVGSPPTISSGSGQSYNLIIDPSATLTVATGGSLSAAGSLIINSSATNNSGSLINQGTVTGSVVYNRTIPDDGATQRWHYISSPVVPTNIISSKSFYPWNEVNGVWGAPTSNIISGTGYTIIGGGSVSFLGSLLSSNLSLDATSPYNDVLTGTNYSGRTYVQGDGHSGTTRSYLNYGGGGFNLLGNPFTSALRVTAGLSANNFLDVNLAEFDPNYVAVYLYNGNSYRYIGSSTGWDIDNPTSLSENHIQVGQAFFVLAMNDYSTFSFTKEMQDHNTSVPLLKSNGSDVRWPGVRLRVKNGDNESSTLIVYDAEMTIGLDPGYDIGLMSAGPGIEIYSVLATDDKSVNYTRQALPVAGIDTIVVPIGLDSRNSGDITFSAETVPLNSYKYLLEDRQTGIITDLGRKTYTTSISGDSYGTGRFFLHTTAINRRKYKPETDYPEMVDVRIWSSGERVIIAGNVSDKAICEIYDMNGQKVLLNHLTDGELNIVKTGSTIKGAIIVKIVDGTKVITKKVVIL